MEYKILVRKVKVPRVEMRDGEIRVIVPPGIDPSVVIKKAKSWIERKMKEQEMMKKEAERLSIVKRSEEEFKRYVLKRIEDFSREIGVKVNAIRFRKMKTRWGSCSPKGQISVNTLLRYLPLDLIDYVLFHEVLHRRYMNHGPAFKKEISKRFPGWKEKEKLLRLYHMKFSGET